ncbi:hypothetical protein T11_16721 [Trichinella zimbabwensis]|uniref:Uncharacterized protein n=1 Tax=Trichinella zimbabwensis TaxID=268475 RepID=A0A0V1I975_9BILA|nr:hypothetical protein T11_16721 [Trichinella zimbabwensis]
MFVYSDVLQILFKHLLEKHKKKEEEETTICCIVEWENILNEFQFQHLMSTEFSWAVFNTWHDQLRDVCFFRPGYIYTHKLRCIVTNTASH